MVGIGPIFNGKLSQIPWKRGDPQADGTIPVKNKAVQSWEPFQNVAAILLSVLLEFSSICRDSYSRGRGKVHVCLRHATTEQVGIVPNGAKIRKEKNKNEKSSSTGTWTRELSILKPSSYQWANEPSSFEMVKKWNINFEKRSDDKLTGVNPAGCVIFAVCLSGVFTLACKGETLQKAVSFHSIVWSIPVISSGISTRNKKD